MPLLNTGKSKTYKFLLPIYGYCVYICVTDNINEAIKRAKLSYGADISDDAVHIKIKDRAESFLFLPIEIDFNLIVHESCHVTQHIISWIGAGYQDKEFVAYLMAHVAQGVYEFHEKAKNYLKAIDK